MPYTAEQEMEFKREFAVRRRRQRVMFVPFLLVVVAIAVARNRFGIAAPGAFLALALMAIVFSARNWRCPACRGRLGRGMNPRFCPRCGVPLADDATRP